MKRLESIKVVNFYLFEREDIRCGEITGIFGPNASGKSSLIDAMQIAMFGANGNLVTLNAQADENKSARTIKSYCLGMNDERVVRDNSTTYISMVWRDTETREPLSMGVCIYASTGSDSHEVRGRYVLPGVELAMHDHLEMVDNKEQPRSWESFRVQIKERSKVSGEDPLYTDSERYIKAVLHALRGAGGVPSPEAFKSAFRFALKMKFNDQVDEVIRRDILEARPTNIQRFKEVILSMPLNVASGKLFKDTKRIRRLEIPLDVLLTDSIEVSGREGYEIWNDIGLFREEHPVRMAGNVVVERVGVTASLDVPYSGLPAESVKRLVSVPSAVITIENQTTFHEEARARHEENVLLIYTAGMPNSPWRDMYVRILQGLALHRFSSRKRLHVARLYVKALNTQQQSAWSLSHSSNVCKWVSPCRGTSKTQIAPNIISQGICFLALKPLIPKSQSRHLSAATTG